MTALIRLKALKEQEEQRAGREDESVNRQLKDLDIQIEALNERKRALVKSKEDKRHRLHQINRALQIIQRQTLIADEVLKELDLTLLKDYIIVRGWQMVIPVKPSRIEGTSLVADGSRHLTLIDPEGQLTTLLETNFQDLMYPVLGTEEDEVLFEEDESILRGPRERTSYDQVIIYSSSHFALRE